MFNKLSTHCPKKNNMLIKFPSLFVFQKFIFFHQVHAFIEVTLSVTLILILMKGTFYLL